MKLSLKKNKFARQLSILAFSTFVLLGAFAAKATTTNNLSRAEIEGLHLARHLCESSPETGLTNSGVMQIRRSSGEEMDVPIQFKVTVSGQRWEADYVAQMTNISAAGGRQSFNALKVVHADGLANRYLVPEASSASGSKKHFHAVTGDQLQASFATSDFWLCDLGLQFFHWPEQKVLPNPTHLKRGRSYTLLESTNPHPSANGYSRVLSWIDKQTGGILEAEAFDAKGKLLKVFEPKSFEKVHGQWELQEMDIRNVQTDSRTRIKFNLPND